jgi:hypothetical protein
MMHACLNCILPFALFIVAGCTAPQPINPSFDVTVDRARNILRHCENHKVSLDRPLVIVGGYLDPGFGPAGLASIFRQVSGDTRIISVSLAGPQTFDDCRSRIVHAVESAFPSVDPNSTTRVDVIGFSMGGVAARYAAQRDPASPTHLRRLNIVRLFTISSPHRGAKLADIRLVVSRLQLDMRPGSAFIRGLDTRADPGERMYSVYAYVRLNDQAVGAANAAPPGQTPWWIGDLPYSSNHSMAYRDPRIVADIALRLRDAQPLTSDPASPLPTDAPSPTPIAPPIPLTLTRVP